jgi:transposase
MIQVQQEKLAILEHEKHKDSHQITTLSLEVTNLKKQAEHLNERLLITLTENSTLKKELETLSKQHQEQLKEISSKDIRYNRMNQEIEKLQVQLHQNNRESKVKFLSHKGKIANISKRVSRIASRIEESKQAKSRFTEWF